MKIWIDATRPAPEGYILVPSVNDAISKIQTAESFGFSIELIDIDYDAGNYASDGGDYTKLLDWLKETGRNYPIHIHATNPIEIEKLREAIVKNGLQEKDLCRSVRIWIDHEANEPNSFYRLDMVNKVKNCIWWCEE